MSSFNRDYLPFRAVRNTCTAQQCINAHASVPTTVLRSLVWAVLWLVCSTVLLAAPQDTSNSSETNLAVSQEQLANQLSKLESLLLRSADLESVDNPTRAALLQQAVAVSKQAQLVDTLIKASKNLSAGQLSEAVEKQQFSRDTLRKLLELLQSENREQRVREQRDQVRRWIEETDRLLRMQSSLRGRTEGGQRFDSAAEDQNRLSEKARQIADDLGQLNPDGSKDQPTDAPTDRQADSQSDSRSDQEGKQKSTDSESPSGEKNQSKSSSQPNESTENVAPSSQDKSENSAESEPAKSDSTQSDSKKSAEQSQDQQSQGEQSQGEQSQGQQSQGQQSQGQQSQGQQSQGQQSQGQQSQGQQSQGQQSSGDSSPSEPQSPTERAQQQIQQAFENMQQAEQALKEAKREGAVQEQREAERILKEAIEQLEQILNQLREEEVKRSLETLETRLRRMLEMQNKILAETNRLHEIAGEQPDRQVLVRSTALGKEQSKVGTEGERALLLLQEEGSSAAFPEALTQVNGDIASSASRLEAGDVGSITVLIQTDIVQSLEEMVQAVDRVRKENDEKKKQRQQQPPGGVQMSPEMQPLIDQLAELRLIRTLQIRVNKRTEVLSRMLSDPADAVGQASDSDLKSQLKELGKRQNSIEEVTRNIAEGP